MTGKYCFVFDIFVINPTKSTKAHRKCIWICLERLAHLHNIHFPKAYCDATKRLCLHYAKLKNVC